MHPHNKPIWFARLLYFLCIASSQYSVGLCKLADVAVVNIPIAVEVFKVHKDNHSSAILPPSAIISNRVQFFRKASISLPVGPFRCLEIMISALPFNSSSSCR
jgi:hypothetical protein